jgi:3-carboxy-cis,cis-muconate cycloisomerase
MAEQYRRTPMIGRTLLQQALPITFGLKAARWLALLSRQIQALSARRERDLVVQAGGAAGTLASLGDKGFQIVLLLAEELKLAVPDLPWHTERDRIGEIAGTLGVIAGSMAKIAHDIALLAQTEIGEVSEGHVAGKGGSSAMPQKRNPVDATRALGASRLAMGVVPVILAALVQEQERAVGGWQSEWVAIPDLFRFTAGAVDGVKSVVVDLQIDPARMRANLDLTGGLVMSESLTMALAPRIGRADAYRLVQDICDHVLASGGDFRLCVREDQQVRSILSEAEIADALDPIHYLGSTDLFIDRALEAYHRLQATS